MCGLAAIFAYRPDAPPVSKDELAAISLAMRARGPDGFGQWVAEDGRIGMAHRRLAIIDLSIGAAQPMTLSDQRHRIVYNGEIYNFRALRRQLEAKGHVFASQSDTEVLLRLYMDEGPEMINRLRGMYAFAIWDNDRRGIFAARDPFGIKPLYYADDGKTLRIASQVKALVAGGHAGKCANAAGRAGFFLFGYVPDPHTIYADIKALEAGCSMWVGVNGDQRIKPFFDVSSRLAKRLAASGAEINLRELLLDSVRHHLVSDAPVGVFLSSGLDSTSLAGLAAEGSKDALATVTLGFKEFAGTPYDETPLAATAAAAYQTSHTVRWVEKAEFLRDYQTIMNAMDQPTIDGVNTYFVAKAAAELGLKAALSGVGGDELFGGYDGFRQIPLLVNVLGSIPGMKTFGKAVRLVTASAARRLTLPKYAGLLEYGTKVGDAYLLRRGLFMPWELPALIGPDMAEEGWLALEPLARLEDCCRPIAEPWRKVAALEMCWYMRNQLLRDADWAGMAHSLEIRTPLVDSWLFAGLGKANHTKLDMARTPNPPLPKAILSRRKTGFFTPVPEWLGDQSGSEREIGLRGWAKRVFAAQTGGV